MTSTNDGKDVKSNQTSGQKGRTYYIELYKSLDGQLNGESPLSERVAQLCSAWRCVHTLCVHSTPPTHPHLLAWIQRHTVSTFLQSEWQSPTSKDERTKLNEAINDFVQQCQDAASRKDNLVLSWESQLLARAVWFQSVFENPWGHPVLKALLDVSGPRPGILEIQEWLKEERGPVFAARLRQLALSKCEDLALALLTAVMDPVRATRDVASDLALVDESKEAPKARSGSPTLESVLSTEAGFSEVWDLLTDMELVLLHKSDKDSRVIDLAKQLPLANSNQVVERLLNRLEAAPKEKRLWKNAKEVAVLVAQVMIARCMVVPVCAGGVRSVLHKCGRALALALPRARLPRATAALAAPAATARHLYTLAAAVHTHQSAESEELKPFVVELYVRALTFAMNELEKLKMKPEYEEKEARGAEQTLASWFLQLGRLLSASARLKCECMLTAFSLHPAPAMYDLIRNAPSLNIDTQPKTEPVTNSEFGSWANDSRSHTNFVKTSEHLKMQQTNHQTNVLSTAIFNEGEALGLNAELCQDISVLLSGPRVKTFSWDLDREALLADCRAYMERTAGGTRTLTTELKYLNINPNHYMHLPEEEDNEDDAYYGIEKGYEHLLEIEPQPEEIWEDAYDDPERTHSAVSGDEQEIHIPYRKKKNKLASSSESDSDPLSMVAEKKEKKKERPHSKERSKERKKKTEDTLTFALLSKIENIKAEDKLHAERRKETKKKEKKEKKERKKREKKVKNSLLGVKVTTISSEEMGHHNICVTDSDNDSQGRSSLLSDDNIVHDGHFSMDELKSLERQMEDANKQKLTLNQYKIATHNTQTKYIKSMPTKKPQKQLSSSAMQSTSLTDASNNIPNMGRSCETIKDEVKINIKKLIQFRRQKASESSNSPMSSPGKDDNSPLGQSPSLVGTKLTNTSSVYGNQKQQELNSMKDEAKSVKNAYQPPGGLQTSNSCSRIQPFNPAYLSKNRRFNPPVDSCNSQTNDAWNLTHQPSASSSSKTSSHLNSYQRFLQELQKNADSRCSYPSIPTEKKKQLRPISKVTPVLPAAFKTEPMSTAATNVTNENRVNPTVLNDTEMTTSTKQKVVKSDPMISQCAKPIVQAKKVENAPNTFARLSYMHKNKLNEKSKQQADTTASLQNSISEELDRRTAELKISKMKMAMIKNDNSMSRVGVSQHAIPNELPRVEVQMNEDLPTALSLSRDHPLLASVLNTNSLTVKNCNEQQKNVAAPSTYTKPKNTSLTEKDQQELLKLLGQQNMLNRPHQQPNVTAQPRTIVKNPQLITKPSNSNTCAVSANPVEAHKETPVQAQVGTIDSKRSIQDQIDETGYKLPVISNTTIMKTTAMIQNNKVSTPPKQTQRKIKQKAVKQINILQKKPLLEVNKAVSKKYAPKPPVSTSVFNQELEEQDWTKVLDAIRSHKTPSRGPNALDIVLNKDSFEKVNVRNQQISSPLPTNKINITNMQTTVAAQVNNPIQQTSTPKPMKSPASTSIQIQPKLKDSVNLPAQLVTVAVKNPLPNPVILYPEVTKQALSSTFYKEDDPFISGNPNSDYEILGELMDDDLRQEIGELLSDEDSYRTPVVISSKDNTNAIKNKTITKKVTAKKPNNVESCPKPTEIISPAPNVVHQIAKAKPRIISNEKVDIKTLSKSLIGSKITRQPPLTMTSKLQDAVIYNIKNTLAKTNSETSTTSTVYNAPQTPAAQKMVIVDPYGMRNANQTFVAVNNTPSIVYQPFPAHVAGQIIIGNTFLSIATTQPAIVNAAYNNPPSEIPIMHIPESTPSPTINVQKNIVIPKQYEPARKQLDPTNDSYVIKTNDSEVKMTPNLSNNLPLNAHHIPETTPAPTITVQRNICIPKQNDPARKQLDSTDGSCVIKTKVKFTPKPSNIPLNAHHIPETAPAPVTVQRNVRPKPFEPARKQLDPTDECCVIKTNASEVEIAPKLSNDNALQCTVETNLTKKGDVKAPKNDSCKLKVNAPEVISGPKIISNKNTEPNLIKNIDKTSPNICERKVLSLVQEKLVKVDAKVPVKIESAKIKNPPIKPSFAPENKKELCKDQERLAVKRLSIINRNINHRILLPVIPLTYTPLTLVQAATRIERKETEVEGNRETVKSICNSRANEGSQPYRRILLRSSNKLASDVIEPEHEDELVGRRTKVRLKDVGSIDQVAASGSAESESTKNLKQIDEASVSHNIEDYSKNDSIQSNFSKRASKRILTKKIKKSKEKEVKSIKASNEVDGEEKETKLRKIIRKSLSGEHTNQVNITENNKNLAAVATQKSFDFEDAIAGAVIHRATQTINLNYKKRSTIKLNTKNKDLTKLNEETRFTTTKEVSNDVNTIQSSPKICHINALNQVCVAETNRNVNEETNNTTPQKTDALPKSKPDSVTEFKTDEKYTSDKSALPKLIASVNTADQLKVSDNLKLDKINLPVSKKPLVGNKMAQLVDDIESALCAITESTVISPLLQTPADKDKKSDEKETVSQMLTENTLLSATTQIAAKTTVSKKFDDAISVISEASSTEFCKNVIKTINQNPIASCDRNETTDDVHIASQTIPFDLNKKEKSEGKCKKKTRTSVENVKEISSKTNTDDAKRQQCDNTNKINNNEKNQLRQMNENSNEIITPKVRNSDAETLLKEPPEEVSNHNISENTRRKQHVAKPNAPTIVVDESDEVTIIDDKSEMKSNDAQLQEETPINLIDERPFLESVIQNNGNHPILLDSESDADGVDMTNSQVLVGIPDLNVNGGCITNSHALVSQSIDNSKHNSNEIPQSYKKSIQFEEIFMPGNTNPLKRYVRIKLPNNKVFRATVHGKVAVSIDTLFEEPALKKLLLNSLNDKKKYTVNIQQPRVVKRKLEHSPLQETSCKLNHSLLKADETVNLISDDEEETIHTVSTASGTFKIKPLDDDILSKHQHVLLKKCFVKLHRCDAKRKKDHLVQALLNDLSLPSLAPSEVIEIDDSSSDGETSQEQTGIDVLKNLLFEELGVNDLLEKSAKDEPQNGQNQLKNGRPCRNRKSKYHQEKSRRSISTEPKKCSSSQINRTNSSKTFKDPTYCQENINLTQNDNAKIITRECFVKLINCDNLVKKMRNETQGIDFDSLCDDEVIDCDNYDTPVMSRCGSFSILNDLDAIEELTIHRETSPVMRVFESIHALRDYNTRNNSPVMEAYEIIAGVKIKAAFTKKQLESYGYENYSCKSEWYETKLNLHDTNIIQTKLMLNMYSGTTSIDEIFKEIVQSKIENKLDTSTDCETDNGTDLSIADSEIIHTKTFMVPSLSSIMSKYFEDNSIIYHLNQITRIDDSPQTQNKLDMFTDCKTDNATDLSSADSELIHTKSFMVPSLLSIMAKYFEDNSTIYQFKRITRSNDFTQTPVKRKVQDRMETTPNKITKRSVNLKITSRYAAGSAYKDIKSKDSTEKCTFIDEAEINDTINYSKQSASKIPVQYSANSDSKIENAITIATSNSPNLADNHDIDNESADNHDIDNESADNRDMDSKLVNIRAEQELLDFVTDTKSANHRHDHRFADIQSYVDDSKNFNVSTQSDPEGATSENTLVMTSEEQLLQSKTKVFMASNIISIDDGVPTVNEVKELEIPDEITIPTCQIVSAWSSEKSEAALKTSNAGQSCDMFKNAAVVQRKVADDIEVENCSISVMSPMTDLNDVINDVVIRTELLSEAAETTMPQCLNVSDKHKLPFENTGSVNHVNSILDEADNSYCSTVLIEVSAMAKAGNNEKLNTVVSEKTVPETEVYSTILATSEKSDDDIIKKHAIDAHDTPRITSSRCLIEHQVHITTNFVPSNGVKRMNSPSGEVILEKANVNEVLFESEQKLSKDVNNKMDQKYVICNTQKPDPKEPEPTLMSLLYQDGEKYQELIQNVSNDDSAMCLPDQNSQKIQKSLPKDINYVDSHVSGSINFTATIETENKFKDMEKETDKVESSKDDNFNSNLPNEYDYATIDNMCIKKGATSDAVIVIGEQNISVPAISNIQDETTVSNIKEKHIDLIGNKTMISSYMSEGFETSNEMSLPKTVEPEIDGNISETILENNSTDLGFAAETPIDSNQKDPIDVKDENTKGNTLFEDSKLITQTEARESKAIIETDKITYVCETDIFVEGVENDGNELVLPEEDQPNKINSNEAQNVVENFGVPAISNIQDETTVSSIKEKHIDLIGNETMISSYMSEGFETSNEISLPQTEEPEIDGNISETILENNGTDLGFAAETPIDSNQKDPIDVKDENTKGNTLFEDSKLITQTEARNFCTESKAIIETDKITYVCETDIFVEGVENDGNELVLPEEDQPNKINSNEAQNVVENFGVPAISNIQDETTVSSIKEKHIDLIGNETMISSYMSEGFETSNEISLPQTEEPVIDGNISETILENSGTDLGFAAATPIDSNQKDLIVVKDESAKGYTLFEDSKLITQTEAHNFCTESKATIETDKITYVCETDILVEGVEKDGKELVLPEEDQPNKITSNEAQNLVENFEECTDTMEIPVKKSITEVENDQTSFENAATLVYKDDSGVILKGIEFEDPDMGTCFVFPLAKSSYESDILSNSIRSSTEVIQEVEISTVTSDDVTDLYNETDLKVLVPKITYSRRSLKRKSDMRDVYCSEKRIRRGNSRSKESTALKVIERKYRKGKNIDFPKLTAASMAEAGNVKDFNRRLNYYSTVRFSYAITFSTEFIDVAELLRKWPINRPISNETQYEDENEHALFTEIDSNNNRDDPLQQTLVEEITTEYNDSNYPNWDTEGTNFNMGFGEGSGRVIQNLNGGTTKFSAATLSDVKQFQPCLMSEKSVNSAQKLSFTTTSKQEQLQTIKRYLTYMQLREKVRSFFKNTTFELTHRFEKKNINDNTGHFELESFPFELFNSKCIGPRPIETIVQVVQVGQLPVSAAAQNPMTCDPRVTQVSDASPSQCSVENSPNDHSQPEIKTEYTELTTADLSLPLVDDYVHHNQTEPLGSQESTNVSMNTENIPIQTELVKSEVKIELEEETPEEKEKDNNDHFEANNHINNDYLYNANNSNTSVESDFQALFDDKHESSEMILQQKPQNGSPEKTDQIAHAMTAAGINTSETANTRAQALVNILTQKIRQGAIVSTPNSTNNYPKATSINAMSLQQALASILPPPLNQTSSTENNQQSQNTVAPQVLHIVQGKNASGNQITLVDNTQQSVITAPNTTPVLHIVQNKAAAVQNRQNSNGTPAPQSNAFSGLSLVDAGLQQGGNQLLHIVNTGNQKNNNAGQLLKRVNLLTNLTNVQGANEQKMVQFVCKSADGKAIQLNAPHQRSMVLRLQPIESPSVQPPTPKPAETNQEISQTQSVANSVTNKDNTNTQQEIKSRSVYEENYAKFIQNSSNKPLHEKNSLPKFNQAFGKAVFQDGNQKQNEINGNSLPPVNTSTDSSECQPTDNAISLDHIGQISSPPLLLRKSPAQTTQAQQNLVQQIKQTIAPMNIQTMHGGVIYTRQIPVNIGGGQTINLITVPSTDLIDEPVQKQQINQGETIEPSIIKIVPQSQPPTNPDVSDDMNNDSAQQTPPQPQPVLTQMRIKLPMLSKTPQMVSGARVVRPSFFQIQRNVIGGGNQAVYQQLVLTAAPPLGQQTIRLPQAQTRQTKVPENQSSSEPQMSSSTLEQLREFDMVLEQVKERSTVQPNSNSTSNFKLHTSSTDTTDSPTTATSTAAETTQVLYSIGSSQPLNVTYVNRKPSVSTPTTSTFVRSPDSTGIADSPSSSSHSQIPHTASESSPSEVTTHNKPVKVSAKSKSRPKSSHHPNSMKLSTVPPKASAQKPLEDEQTTQRILYILAEYKEQVENSPDKDKPAPRRRNNPPSNPSGSSKRKKSSSGSRRSGRDMSPINGDESCRTMGSEDSSCGTSQGDCTENCMDSHSPQDSPRKVARKINFDQDPPTPTPTPPAAAPTTPQPKQQPQRNVIVADSQTITVARSTGGKPATAVLMPANYILPVSMVKGGQQIAIVTNRGPKLLTVGGGEGGTTNALLLQRLIGPAGLKPVLARPGVRHVRLPTAALHNLQAFNLAAATSIQPPDSTASSATPPDLIETNRADHSPWRESEIKPDRASSPDDSEPWNLPTSADPHDYGYEETVRTDNMDRTVLDPIQDRYSPDMEAQRIFDKMFDVDTKRSYIVDSHVDSPRYAYDIDASDCDDKPYQVVHKREGYRQARLSHVSAAALRHKYAILEHELRLQKSLSEECEDLGVDSPSASELFPEAELLFAASPAQDHAPDTPHQSHTPQPTLLNQSVTQPDIDDQIATDQLLPRHNVPDDRQELGLGLEDVGIVTVSEDGMQATIALDQEEFARSHPNTTFHSEPTDDGEVQPFTITGLKSRHIQSTIFHSNRAPATVLMTAPQTTVISQVTAEGSQNTVKYSEIDNMIHSIPSTHTNNINLSPVVVKDDGLTRFDNILTDSRELHLSNTASAIVHPAGNATQVIRRVCYDGGKRARDSSFLMDEPDALIAGDDAKMIAEDSSRDATLESMTGDVDDGNSSPERHGELFWESNSASERSESRRPLDFSSDSDKCCKSPSYDETNSTDSSGVGAHMRLDSVIKEARGIDRSGSADGSSADDTHPPLRTYPAKRLYHSAEGEMERSLSGKTRAGERSPDIEVRRRASGRGVVKRGCHCCNGSPVPPRPKKPRQRKPTMEFTN